MNRFILFGISTLLLVSCAKPWQASAAEKSTAAKMRILNVNDGKWTHLSKDITLFSQLERLNFQNNVLRELPDFIKEMQKLKWLNVADNQLEELPQALASLETIERLNISN